MSDQDLPSSFRDPSGSLFLRDGVLHRRVNRVYQEHYDHLMGSGLYHALVGAGLLVPHEEVPPSAVDAAPCYKILRPEPVGFISYPYEWCFSQLQDAALATLAIQETALDHGMCLKDASAYNIQFRNGKPVLIDTLSFERYEPGRPWVAYRQFCQHFVAPLALMAYADARLGQLLRVHIDGIPLDLASRLLPRRSRLSPSLYVHLHLHARVQQRFAERTVDAKRRQVSPAALRGLVGMLKSLVGRLKWKPDGTAWSDYYHQTNYSPAAARDKRRLVERFVDAVTPKTVWDLGANVGLYSRIASDRGIHTIAFDADPAAVEKNYVQCREAGETHLLPLVLDLTNPSPALGWANQERMSLRARGPADLALALALVHHLAIGNNVPFASIARFFASICEALVIEFVPKHDSQLQRMLASREDVFPDYTQVSFERAFGEHFLIETSEPIAESQRTVHLMRRKRA